MPDAPYPLALAAGVLAAVNPCGFALLPAYVSLLVVGDAAPQRRGWAGLGRALALTAAMTLGFVTVFGVFGLLVAPVADWLAQRLPWVTIIIGVVLVALGGWLLAGRELPSPVPKAGRAPVLRRSLGSIYVFGMSFAIASLGCTIGPFLAVVVTSFGTGSVAASVGLFFAYAGGMALVVGTVAVAVALAQQSLVRAMRRVAPALSRLAGLLMAAAGAYVAWYGWYEIRIFRDPDTTDPIVAGVVRVQTEVAAFLHSAGVGVLAITLAGLMALASMLVWLRRRAK